MKYSGRTTDHSHKFDDWRDNLPLKNPKPAVQDAYLFDVQWSDCPVEIEAIVQKIWNMRGLGNDNFMYKTSLLRIEEEIQEWDELLASQDDTDAKEELEWKIEQDHPTKGDWQDLRDFLLERGITDVNKQIIIFWWW